MWTQSGLGLSHIFYARRIQMTFLWVLIFLNMRLTHMIRAIEIYCCFDSSHGWWRRRRVVHLYADHHRVPHKGSVFTFTQIVYYNLGMVIIFKLELPFDVFISTGRETSAYREPQSRSGFIGFFIDSNCFISIFLFSEAHMKHIVTC